MADCAENQVSWNRNGSLKKKKTLGSIKALFGRSSLWRRRKWRKFRSIVLLNLITIVFASNIPVVKEVEAIVDPVALMVVWFAVCAIPFLLFVIQAWDDVHMRNAAIELGFWLSLGYMMQAIGLLTSDAGCASFMSMITVLVVPFLDGMLGAVVPALTWLGALMSILGVALLESSGSSPSISSMHDVSATETAALYGLEPVWGAGFAWFLLGERWAAIGWIGAALVIRK